MARSPVFPLTEGGGGNIRAARYKGSRTNDQPLPAQTLQICIRVPRMYPPQSLNPEERQQLGLAASPGSVGDRGKYQPVVYRVDVGGTGGARGPGIDPQWQRHEVVWVNGERHEVKGITG